METQVFGDIVLNRTTLDDSDVPVSAEWLAYALVDTTADGEPTIDTYTTLDGALKARWHSPDQSGLVVHVVIAEGYSLSADEAGEPEAEVVDVESADESDTDIGAIVHYASLDATAEREAEINAFEDAAEYERRESGEPTDDSKAGTFSTLARERIDRHDALFAKLGLARPGSSYSTADMRVIDGEAAPATKKTTEAGYEAGTRALREAYARLRTSRRKWEQRPLIELGLDMLRTNIRNENRSDILLPARDLTMDDTGKLVIPGAGVVALEAEGFKALLPKVWGDVYVGEASRLRKGGAVFPEAFNFLVSMPPDERAACMNRAFKRADKDCTVRLLTRTFGNGPQVYMVAGKQYARFDADKVAEIVGQELAGKGLRGEVTYDGTTTDCTIDATHHADDNMKDLSAGDAFQVGYRFRSNDSGKGAIRGGGAVDWNACLNFLILSHDENEVFRQIHKGAMGDIRTEVEAQVKAMQPVFEEFAREWGCLRENHVANITLWGQSFNTTAEALTYAVEHGKLSVEHARDVAVEMMLRAHERQGGGDALSDVIDSITRYAHEAMLADIQRDILEREAGAMVPVMYAQL